MAVRHGYGKIAGTDALVFAYDTGDTRNSYKGEPTENLITNPIPTSTSGFSRSGGTGTVTYDSTKNAVYWEQTTYSTWGAYFNFFPGFTGTLDVNSQYTFSVEYYNQSDFAETGINYNLVQGNGQSGAAYYNNITTKVVEIGGGWKRFTHTFTPANSGVSAAYNRFIVGNKGTDVLRLWFRNIQFEKKSKRTPFVAGTRSATQGLLDLIGNNTIDLSNVSFDSNAQKTFDGTDDHISGILPILGNGAPHTIEIVMSPSINQNAFGSRRDPFTIGNATTHQYSSLDVNTGYMNWYFYSRDTTFTNSPLMTAGNYYHMVLSYAGGASNNTNKQVWYNGVKQTLSAGSSETSLLPDNPQFSIGRDIGRNTAYFPGEVPVFKVYNRALTEAEALSNFKHYKTRFGI